MNVKFDGIGHCSATFIHDSGEVGQVCRISAAGTVSACNEGDVFCGVIESIRGGYATVQLHGFATVKLEGTAPSLGYVSLTAGGNGGVADSGTGRQCLCVDADESAGIVVIEL